jgi:hypothetical protein
MLVEATVLIVLVVVLVVVVVVVAAAACNHLHWRSENFCFITN